MLSRWNGGLGGVLALGACALTMLACASSSRSSTSGFSDGRGFGLRPAEEARGTRGGAVAKGAFSSASWDVNVNMAPGSATVTERDDSWSLSNVSQSTPNAGQFLLMVLRSDDVIGASPRAVADVLRDDDVRSGLQVTDIADSQLLGKPAVMYASTTGDGVFNVTLLTVFGQCVYVLNVTRAGQHEQLVDYLGGLLGAINTYTGAPLDAPACR